MPINASIILKSLASTGAAALALLAVGCAANAPTGNAGALPAAQQPRAAYAPVPSRMPSVLAELPGDASASASSTNAGFQQHTASDEGYDADVTADPSGKWIAFTSTRHSEHSHIYMQRVDGTAVTQLTGEAGDDAQPAFSPDGKRVAFCSTRSGNWDIYVMDVDGRNIEQVTDTSGHEMHPSFSPDGARLVYCALSPRTDQWELWTINIATRERKIIGNGIFPVWSPSKEHDRIAFQRARQRGSRCYSLWTLDLVDGEPRRTTEVAASANAAVISPTWSPDGSYLAFTTVLLPTAGAAPSKPHQDIWAVAADGSGRRRLTEGLATNLSPFWAVDNRIYFISDRAGHDNIWSVRIDGTAGAATAAVHAAPAHGASAEPHAAALPDGPPVKSEKPAAVGATDTREIGH